jgi:hypothetical protein
MRLQLRIFNIININIFDISDVLQTFSWNFSIIHSNLVVLRGRMLRLVN